MDSEAGGVRRVILVPGYGFGGIELFVFRRRLAAAGYEASIHYGWPWPRTIEESATRLAACVVDRAPCHLVGHSFGGLVILALLAAWPALPATRIVTLATPHRPPQAAARIARLPGGRRLLGAGLRSAIPRLPIAVASRHELGTVLGRIDWGLGRLLRLDGPSDSVVRLEEAHHPQERDAVVLAQTHASLLFSRAAVRAVGRFLGHGRFA